MDVPPGRVDNRMKKGGSIVISSKLSAELPSENIPDVLPSLHLPVNLLPSFHELLLIAERILRSVHNWKVFMAAVFLKWRPTKLSFDDYSTRPCRSHERAKLQVTCRQDPNWLWSTWIWKPTLWDPSELVRALHQLLSFTFGFDFDQNVRPREWKV